MRNKNTSTQRAGYHMVLSAAAIAYTTPTYHSFSIPQHKAHCYNQPFPLSTKTCTSSSIRKGEIHQKLQASSNEDGVDMERSNENKGGLVVSKNLFETTGDYLAEAFASLKDDDKYDAVLVGICAKILDTGSASGGDGEALALESTSVWGVMDKPFNLMIEMNDRKVRASGRSLSAFVDTAASVQDARTMAKCLSLSIKNGGASRYGSSQSSLTSFSGSYAKRKKRLEKLPEIPLDNRAAEVSGAVSFLTLASVCVATNPILTILGNNESPYPSLLLGGLILLGIVDNAFDALTFISKSVDKVPTLPEKDKMPFGIGKGEITGTVVAGLNRLITVDTERECQSEAAAFFVAYSLGLSCFAFQPNALEAAVMVFESNKKQDEAVFDSFLSIDGVTKMCIWLLAPVAMEKIKHPQLLVSDPREASGLLRRLRERAESMGISSDVMESLGLNDEEEAADLLKWAYAEADILVRTNMNICEELGECLAGGAATVGDCVGLLESW
mmetsp:Transcript_56128/g.65552  ORF Transcript_56128/g.65552 Transcript_56128/m.65552 type:complete len:500 (-) Transcript_56128:300-1799(-)